MSFGSNEKRDLWTRSTVWICACIALATAIVPFARACFRVEVNYNEGWNIYNATTVANHGLLYPEKYGWTTVNYPLLSFFLMAQLHRVTHDFLFTARAVSLLSLVACCVLVGAIVRRLGSSTTASCLAALYCVAVFCADAHEYVGMDDPQIFAQVFFLAGLWVFLWRRESLAALAGAALLFVIGGFIKHNPIDFPLAVLVELCLVSRLRAAWFGTWGLLLAGLGVWLNIRYGGPFFLSQLLAPRVYAGSKVPEQFLNVFGPLLIPFLIALYTAFILRKDKQRRIAAILLVTSLVVGGYFGGGQGVSINCLFSAILATAILIGLFFDDVQNSRFARAPASAQWIPVTLFSWMVIPMILNGNWNIAGRLRQIAAAEKRFDADVALLHERSGPALCESLLRCDAAGKDYEYDPFNATRLIHFGKLDAGLIVDRLRQQQYGAIELDQPVDDPAKLDRFDPAILAAIQQNYAPALSSQDAVIYIPR